MQQHALYPSLRLGKYTTLNPVLSKKCEMLKDTLQKCEKLRVQGVPWKDIQQILGISRAS